jgi:hypothetical protein
MTTTLTRAGLVLLLAIPLALACAAESSSEPGADASSRDVADARDATDAGSEVPEIVENHEPETVDASETHEPEGCRPGEPADRPLAGVADHTFLKGPYLMHVTTTSIVVMWESAMPTLGLVEYGVGDGLDLRAEEAAEAQIHEVRLEGLEPDSRYAYRVSSGDLISETHHFHTAPLPGSPIRYTVWGDSRSDPETCAAVVESMVPFHPYLNMNVGDVVEDGRILEQWSEEYFEPLRPLGHEVPSYVAIGNHEANALYFYDYFGYPYPEEDPWHETYYSFTYGNTFFVVIDTNKPFFPIGEAKLPQIVWFEEVIASPEAQAATWRVAFAHHPGWSEGWDPGGCGGYDGTPAVRSYLIPALAEHDFHVYFAGHTHDYERGFSDGLLQVISGGGGASLDQWCEDFDHVTAYASAYHHMQVTATCEELRVDAVALDGERLDHIVLRADAPGVISEEDPAVPEPCCGDGIVMGLEICDGDDLLDATCATEGLTGDGLACADDCMSLDVSACGPPPPPR